MKNYFNSALVKVKDETYIKLISLIVPLLNFLSGVSFDLHAPSLPMIATYFNASSSQVKSTISITLLGFSIGCLLFGALLDKYGRRPIIMLCLLIYSAASFSALACKSIEQLLFVRFIQGFAVACVSIGCRTIVVDKFTGHQFKIVLLYTSLAFGIGPIMAPFIGGYLQYHFGWKANFVTYGVIACCLLLMFFTFIAESKDRTNQYNKPKNILKSYIEIACCKGFFLSSLVMGLSQVQLLVYTTVGSLLVENILHKSAITYGNSALIISSGYLIGTLSNRIFIRKFALHNLISFGFLVLLSGSILQFSLAIFSRMQLITIIIPIWIICFSNGFIFINLFSSSLGSLSKNNTGIATSLITSTTMIIGSVGIYLISHIVISSLTVIACIFAPIIMLQFIIYSSYLRKAFINRH